MKNFDVYIFSGVGLVAVLAAILFHPITVSAWGDNTPGDKGRPSYSLEQVNKGELGNKIVFNSITIADTDYAYYKNTFGKDLPVGTITHEKNFVGAREDTGVNAGADNVWNGNEITVAEGKIFLIRLYLHNDNPNGWDGVAENTKVAFNVPAQTSELVKQDDGTMKQQVQVNGYISSSNATPSEYWDYVNFIGDVPFHLEFLQNSALLENNGIGKGGYILDNNIIDFQNGGTLIGYDALDGRVPGCYGFANFVTIKVKAVFDYDFKIEKKVRFVSDKKWQDVINAKAGDDIEFQIKYTNTSDVRQTNVVIKNDLPENLTYVKGTAILKSTMHPEETEVDIDDFKEPGIKIGDYKPGTNAQIIFRAKIHDKDLTDGANTLVSCSQASVGSMTAQDYATVVLYKNPAWFWPVVIILLILIVICLIAIILIRRKRRS